MLEYKIGDTTYSLLHDKGTGEIYIVETVYKHIPKWSFLGYTRYRKIIESIDYIPINLSTLALLHNTLKLKPEHEDYEDDEYVKYEVVDKAMNDKIRKDFNKQMEKLEAPADILASTIVGDLPNNNVVKGFVKDGWHYFSTETDSTLRRTFYLYRTGVYEGYLHLMLVDEIGFANSDTIVSYVSSAILPREFMLSVLMEFDYINNEGEK